VHPREISFTAARRAVISSVRSGAATASLPAALTAANRDAILAGLARRRVQVDRHRHRDRKTKARLGFPHGGPGMPHAHRTSPDQRLRHHSGLTSRRPRSRAVTSNAVEPAAALERHPGHRHALTQRHHPPIGKDRRAHPRSCATKWHWDLT
jgi:hypothetical protein